jgi:Putative peptidoglycan binding domain
MFAGQRTIPARGPARDGVFGALCAITSQCRGFLANQPWKRVRFPRVFAVVLRHPRDAMLAIGATVAVTAIVANSLFLQTGPHPAPIFAIRPPPVVSREATGTLQQLPRPRPTIADVLRSDGVLKVDAVPLPRPRAQPAALSAHPDPIADLINPARHIGEVQRALNDFGYGPVKVTGTFDDGTREGIERFERDHGLAVTGQNTPRLRRALSVATGRALD